MERCSPPLQTLPDEARLLRAARSLEANRRRIQEAQRREARALGVLLAGLAQLGQSELTVGAYHLQLTADDLTVTRHEAPPAAQLSLPSFAPRGREQGPGQEAQEPALPALPPRGLTPLPAALQGTPALYEGAEPYHAPRPTHRRTDRVLTPTSFQRPRQVSFLAPEDARMLVQLETILERARSLFPTAYRPPEQGRARITSPADVAALLRERMASLPQEQLRILTLSVSHDLLAEHLVYQGKLSSAEVRPADIFRRACLDNAAALIAVHNHPSGDPTPSAADVQVTRTLVEVGRELQIPVLDHVVVAMRGYVSLRERGLL